MLLSLLFISSNLPGFSSRFSKLFSSSLKISSTSIRTDENLSRRVEYESELSLNLLSEFFKLVMVVINPYFSSDSNC